MDRQTDQTLLHKSNRATIQVWKMTAHMETILEASTDVLQHGRSLFVSEITKNIDLYSQESEAQTVLKDWQQVGVFEQIHTGGVAT